MAEEPLGERLVRLAEEGVEDLKRQRLLPTQEFADQLRELRQRQGLSVEQFSERYGIPTAEIVTAELARGVKPNTKMRLLVEMIKADPQGVANLIASLRNKDNSKPQQH